MSQIQKRQHQRSESNLPVDVRIARRSAAPQTLFTGTGQITQCGVGGVRIRVFGGIADNQLVPGDDLGVWMIVHVSPKERVELSGVVRWVKHEGDAALIGVQYQGAEVGGRRRVFARAKELGLDRSLMRYYIAAGIVLLLLMQSVRFFMLPGTPENAAVSRVRRQLAPTAPQAVYRPPVQAAPVAVSGAPVEGMSKRGQTLLDAHAKEGRDETWAGPSERLLKDDFNKLVSGFSEYQGREWGVRVDELDCRTKTCVAKVTTNGYSEFRSFFEDKIYFQGELIPSRLPFEMKCRPTPVFREVEGAVQSSPGSYSAYVHLDCGRPVWTPMGPPPDASKDRLLNPALQHLLPPDVQANLGENVARAKLVHAAKLKAYNDEKARREDPNFVRVEPPVR